MAEGEGAAVEAETEGAAVEAETGELTVPVAMLLSPILVKVALTGT